MENQNADLNSILESARAQLEIFRKSSKGSPIKAAKDSFSSNPEDSIENTSGSILNTESESTEIDVGMINSGSNVSTAEINEAAINLEYEESSNKNFDSSTISLGDQQSFQNQSELTTQTTYTNVHQPSAPYRDDFIVVTGPIMALPSPTEESSQQSDMTQLTKLEFESEQVKGGTESRNENRMTIENDPRKETEKPKENGLWNNTEQTNEPEPALEIGQVPLTQLAMSSLDTKQHNLEELTQNQMAGTFMYFGSGQPTGKENIRETKSSMKDIEGIGSQKKEIVEIDTGKTGSVRPQKCSHELKIKDVLQETGKLSNLKIEGCNKASVKDRPGAMELTDAKKDNETREDNNISVNVSALKKGSIFDNPLVPDNFTSSNVSDVRSLCFIQPFATDLKSSNYTQRLEGRDDKNHTNNDNYEIANEKNKSYDEGFIDSKESHSVTVIFDKQSQNLEDDKNTKLFDNDECTSKTIGDSGGCSVDQYSDLEAKPSLTDVHVMEKQPKNKAKTGSIKSTVFKEINKVSRSNNNSSRVYENALCSDARVGLSIVSSQSKVWSSFQNGILEQLTCAIRNDMNTLNNLTVQRFHHFYEKPRRTGEIRLSLPEILESIKILIPSEVIIYGERFQRINQHVISDEPGSSSWPSTIVSSKMFETQYNVPESMDQVVPDMKYTGKERVSFNVPYARSLGPNIVSFVPKQNDNNQDYLTPNILNVPPFINNLSKGLSLTAQGQTCLATDHFNQATFDASNKIDCRNVNNIDNQLFSICSSFLEKPLQNISLNKRKMSSETLNDAQSLNVDTEEKNRMISSKYLEGIPSSQSESESIVNDYKMKDVVSTTPSYIETQSDTTDATAVCLHSPSTLEKRIPTPYFHETLIPETPEISSIRNSTNEVTDSSLRSPPRPPPRVRRNRSSSKGRFNFFKKLFGINTKRS